jgi:DNA processing protein
VNGIGPVILKRIAQQFGSLAAAWSASPAEWLQVDGVGLILADAIAQARSQVKPEQLLQQHERRYPCFWTPADADYPRLLLEIPDPPPILYYRGQVDFDENCGITPTVGIVGTRSPSDYGRRWTRKLSSSLTRNGFTVISGLADGIDTEAHRSCLELKGRTIAVLGTGVDIVYPRSNRFLYKHILEQGLVISEYPDGTPPDRAHFPQRNRIIAGLSRAVLVTEAPHRSGALITARLANEYCRDVYVLPGSLDNPRSQGCLGLINQGAHVILGEGHLLESLGAMPRLHVVDEQPEFDSQPLPPLSPTLERVLKAVPFEPTPFDLIVSQANLPTSEILSALTQLEIFGLVTQLPGTRYRRS